MHILSCINQNTIRRCWCIVHVLDVQSHARTAGTSTAERKIKKRTGHWLSRQASPWRGVVHGSMPPSRACIPIYKTRIWSGGPGRGREKDKTIIDRRFRCGGRVAARRSLKSRSCLFACLAGIEWCPLDWRPSHVYDCGGVWLATKMSHI